MLLQDKNIDSLWKEGHCLCSFGEGGGEEGCVEGGRGRGGGGGGGGKGGVGGGGGGG